MQCSCRAPALRAYLCCYYLGPTGPRRRRRRVRAKRGPPRVSPVTNRGKPACYNTPPSSSTRTQNLPPIARLTPCASIPVVLSLLNLCYPCKPPPRRSRESIIDIARGRTGWLIAFCVGLLLAALVVEQYEEGAHRWLMLLRR